MTIELWVFPATFTLIAFYVAIRTTVENTRYLGTDGLGVFARILAWSINLFFALIASATGWLVTAAIYLILKTPL